MGPLRFREWFVLNANGITMNRDFTPSELKHLLRLVRSRVKSKRRNHDRHDWALWTVRNVGMKPAP